MVRVRFAPSPTGNLHIGGARTALFNWLYARAKAGKFILRIEDTDLVRSKKEYLDEILNSLSWLGLEWDELYHQSERFQLYRDYAKELLSKGLAYQEAEAIIFKVPPQKIKIQDLIHGQIEFDSSLIKDQVLIKSDKSPTYNFACVVDDHLMEISHVIRAEEWMASVPKHVLLYQAFGWDLPIFAHLPILRNPDKSKLSKRKNPVWASWYLEQGFLWYFYLRSWELLLFPGFFSVTMIQFT